MSNDTRTRDAPAPVNFASLPPVELVGKACGTFPVSTHERL